MATYVIAKAEDGYRVHVASPPKWTGGLLNYSLPRSRVTGQAEDIQPV
jgi:hypothetical protein